MAGGPRSRRASSRLVLLLALAGCGGGEPAPRGPSVLWIVWDTVRADRLSLHGHAKPTTPFLERWAEGARVFEDCVSTASSTTPSHAAMFTGMLPSEHGANNAHQWVQDEYDTIAELFRDAGYATFLWAANPHVSAHENFQQGFDVELHPWDEATREEALAIVRAKVADNPSSDLVRKLRGEPGLWTIKAAGELAQPALEEWLAAKAPERPFFAFINYMEAHHPYIPSLEAQRRTMTPEQIARLRKLDLSWGRLWAYNFGLEELDPADLDALSAAYDATLTELDALLERLLTALEASGHLEDTVVVLTADHGEHLGEQHMLDHQYTLYAPATRVPLVIHYPARLAPGRDRRPVMNFDLFPTLRELAGLRAPRQGAAAGRSLLDADGFEGRERVSEYPAVVPGPLALGKRIAPDWDPAPFARRLHAVEHEGLKLIRGEDGRHELYDVAADPLELRDLAAERSDAVARLAERLDRILAGLRAGPEEGDLPAMGAEQLELLEGLGYSGR